MTKVAYEQEYEVYTYGESLCSQMVRIACVEKGIEWKSIPVMLSEVAVESNNLTPQYLAINPKARVPSLVHNGTPILESYEIIKYLDRQNPNSGPQLYPEDEDLRNRIDAWVLDASLRDDGEFGTTLGMAIPMVSSPVIRYCLKRQPFWHVMRKFSKHPLPSRGIGFRVLRIMPVPRGITDKSVEAIAQALVNIENELSGGNDYVLGAFTQVDVMMMAHFHRLEDVALGAVLVDGTLPNISAYWARLQARPSYESTVLAYHEPHWREALQAVFGDSQSPEIGKLRDAINRAM